MRLFLRKDGKPDSSDNDLAAKLQDCEDNCRFLIDAVKALLDTMKAAVVDDAKTGADPYLKAIDDLYAKVASEPDTQNLRPFFEKQNRAIGLQLQRQREILKEKEKEYKDIIAILTKAMADINTDNMNFAETIFQQSEKIEQITQLEDIKSIKSALAREIASMRTTVKEKQSKDAKVIEQLSEQVNTLKTELETSQQAFMRDGLTGLYNEQALNRYMKTIIAPGAGPQSLFSMLVIDIDKFDKIEKTYGTALGQRVILAASQECRNVFQKDEFMARYKKGTFVIILPSETLKSAVNNAKKLYKTISKKRYQIDEGLEGHTLSITVSIGVSRYRKQDTAATVTSRAIQALYAARRSGSNHVVSEKTVFLRFKRGGSEKIEDLHC